MKQAKLPWGGASQKPTALQTQATTAAAAPVPRAAAMAPTGPNAFAMMMKTAAAPARKESFDLTCSIQGSSQTWSWRWLPAAVVEPCASACTASQTSASGASSGSAGGPSASSAAPEAAWSHQHEHKLEGSIKLASTHLSTNVPSSSSPGGGSGASSISSANTAGAAGKSTCHLSMSQVKSCLQKAMRRGMVTSAVEMAAEIWRREPVELIRRLPVILIEDCAAHPALPLLGWLLLATASGYVPSDIHADALLHIVRQVTACRYRDEVSGEPAAEGSGPRLTAAAEAAAVDTLSPAAAALIRTLRTRARFGGMKGDVEMLYQSAAAWKGRLSGGDADSWLLRLFAAHGIDNDGGLAGSRCNFQCPAQALALVPAVRRAHVPLAGLDFHCSSILTDTMQRAGIAAGTTAAAACTAAGAAAAAAFSADHTRPSTVAVVVSAAACILAGVPKYADAPLEDSLQSLMWRYRSSCNARQQALQALDPYAPLNRGQGGGDEHEVEFSDAHRTKRRRMGDTVEASGGSAASAADAAAAASSSAAAAPAATTSPTTLAYQLLEPHFDQWSAEFLRTRVPA